MDGWERVIHNTDDDKQTEEEFIHNILSVSEKEGAGRWERRSEREEATSLCEHMIAFRTSLLGRSSETILALVRVISLRLFAQSHETGDRGGEK